MILKKTIALAVFTLLSLQVITAQKNKAVITFKNGTTKSGLGKLIKDGVKFRLNKKSKAKKYDFDNIKKVKIYTINDIETYVKLKIKDKNKPRVLEELAAGNVYLYELSRIGYTNYGGVGFGGVGGGVGAGAFGGATYNINNFYVRRQNEKEAYHLGSNQLFTKNFKKAASSYFKDCSSLVAKIQNKELKKRDLREIVEYYNTKCQK